MHGVFVLSRHTRARAHTHTHVYDRSLLEIKPRARSFLEREHFVSSFPPTFPKHAYMCACSRCSCGSFSERKFVLLAADGRKRNLFFIEILHEGYLFPNISFVYRYYDEIHGYLEIARSINIFEPGSIITADRPIVPSGNQCFPAYEDFRILICRALNARNQEGARTCSRRGSLVIRTKRATISNPPGLMATRVR